MEKCFDKGSKQLSTKSQSQKKDNDLPRRIFKITIDDVVGGFWFLAGYSIDDSYN